VAAASPAKEVAVGSKSRAKVERPSAVMKRWSPVEARSTTRTLGCAARAAAKPAAMLEASPATV
jgi:hypothetical protein